MDWLDHLAAYAIGGLMILMFLGIAVFMFIGPFLEMFEGAPKPVLAGCGCMTLVIGIIALAIMF